MSNTRWPVTSHAHSRVSLLARASVQGDGILRGTAGLAEFVQRHLARGVGGEGSLAALPGFDCDKAKNRSAAEDQTVDGETLPVARLFGSQQQVACPIAQNAGDGMEL